MRNLEHPARAAESDAFIARHRFVGAALTMLLVVTVAAVVAALAGLLLSRVVSALLGVVGP